MEATLNISSEIVTVTPQLAKEWLERHNISYNRSLSPTRTSHYISIIKRGEWRIGDALKFDMEGMLIDGQHRLKAVSMAGIPVRFLVLRGFDPSAAQILDRGMNRTLGNIAQLKGHQWITSAIVSIFNGMFFAVYDSVSTVDKNLTDLDKINAILTCKEGILLSSYKGCVKQQRGKGLNTAVLKSVVARAFYSPKSSLYYYKGSNFKKQFTPALLKDFLLLIYGFSYFSEKEMFSQTELDPSAPTRLRDMFLSNAFPMLPGVQQASKIKFKFCETALLKYLTNLNVKTLRENKDNLFPVDWIDDLTFTEK